MCLFKMKYQQASADQFKSQITVEEVNRILEVGQLLLSVLSEDELMELSQLLGNKGMSELIDITKEANLGNISVS